MQLGTIKKDWQTLGLSFPKSFMWNLIEFNLHYLHCAPPRRPPAVCTVFIIHETQTVPNSSTLVGSSCSSSPDRRHHERDRPPAGRPVRQPDRVQGEISKYNLLSQPRQLYVSTSKDDAWPMASEAGNTMNLVALHNLYLTMFQCERSSLK